jgi:hypothetical protein
MGCSASAESPTASNVCALCVRDALANLVPSPQCGYPFGGDEFGSDRAVTAGDGTTAEPRSGIVACLLGTLDGGDEACKATGRAQSSWQLVALPTIDWPGNMVGFLHRSAAADGQYYPGFRVNGRPLARADLL